MIRNYVKIAFRNLKKEISVNSINIFGLSIGMTAAVFILLWVKNELSYDSYHRDAGNIYRITDTLKLERNDQWIWETASYPMLTEARRSIPEITASTRMVQASWKSMAFNINGRLFGEKKSAFVDKGWFDIFRYDFIEGSPVAFEENPHSLILTASTAEKYFGDRSALGQTVLVDSVAYQVSGVVKDNPSNSTFQYNLLMPLAAFVGDPLMKGYADNWNSFNYLTFLKLREHTDIAAVSRKLTSLMDKNRKNNTTHAGLIPLQQIHFETELQYSSIPGRGNRKAVYVFTVMAVLLLLIACINYVNLTTARASVRARETSVRKIVGAERRHLIGQFMAEALLISAISLGFTLLLIQLCLPLFNNITGKIFTSPLKDAGMWGILAATLLAALLLNGVYPAVLLSSFKPLSVLRGVSILKIKDAYLRKGLVVAQFVISIVLISSAIVIYRQMNYVQQRSAGYDRSQVLAVDIPHGLRATMTDSSRAQLLGTVKQELLSQSSIHDVTLTSGSVIDLRSMVTGAADWDGREKDFNPPVTQLQVDEDFMKLFGLSLKAGRWFRAGHADEENVVLNETAVKELGIREPVIGRRFLFQGKTGQVIGVVKDFHYKSMHDKIGPIVLSGQRSWSNTIFIKVQPGQVRQVIANAGGVWKKLLPAYAFEYMFLDEAFDNLYQSDRRTATLVLIFSIIAIIIAALGLFGLAAFTAERRKKEIGIRKILGASVGNIVNMLSRDFLLQVLIASGVAFPLAFWAMSRWLEGFAYRINIGWWVFVAAGALAAFIALATVSLHAVKAALTNPAKSLRTE
jgi:putative ABC transport system permease protein